MSLVKKVLPQTLGKKGLLKSLNQRLYAIRRISNYIPNDKLKQMANRIWIWTSTHNQGQTYEWGEENERYEHNTVKTKQDAKTTRRE